jgi:hypothetical protein
VLEPFGSGAPATPRVASTWCPYSWTSACAFASVSEAATVITLRP